MPVQGCSTLRAAPRRRRPSEALPPRRPGRAREVQARSSAAPRIAPPVCTAPGHGDGTRGRRTARHPWPRPWTRALRSAPCSCAPASGAALGDPPAVAGTGTTWGPRSYPSPGRVRFETQASPRLRLAPQGARVNVRFGLAWVPGPPPTPAQQRQLDGAFAGGQRLWSSGGLCADAPRRISAWHKARGDAGSGLPTGRFRSPPASIWLVQGFGTASV